MLTPDLNPPNGFICMGNNKKSRSPTLYEKVVNKISDVDRGE